jgi:hypothetical protein
MLLLMAGVGNNDSGEYFRYFSSKFYMAPIGYLGTRGKLISGKKPEENLVSAPFKHASQHPVVCLMSPKRQVRAARLKLTSN